MSLTTETTIFDIFREAGEQIDADNVYLKVSSVAGGPSGNVNVTNGAGASAVNIQDGGNSITVDATNLDIRDLVFATDKVDASGTTLGANSGVDVGDVTINNAAGAGAVNIQDGGNSITVDGSVSATQSGTWVLGANSGVDIGDVTINNAAGASAVNIQDGGNSITVDGTVAATQSGSWTVSTTGTTTVAGIVSTKTDLTSSSPVAASVGTSSAQVVAANANRKGLTLINTSVNTISLGVGATAVLNSGYTLYPGGSFNMDEYCFDTAAVNAIASAAASNLAIQECTT